MKATGIVRRIDDLGRIVIPKEIRRTMRIREGDPLEIYTDKNGEVIFKKYSLIGELSQFAGEYAEVVMKSCNMPIMISDRETVIACAGVPRKRSDRQARFGRARIRHGSFARTSYIKSRRTPSFIPSRTLKSWWQKVAVPHHQRRGCSGLRDDTQRFRRPIRNGHREKGRDSGGKLPWKTNRVLTGGEHASPLFPCPLRIRWPSPFKNRRKSAGAFKTLSKTCKQASISVKTLAQLYKNGRKGKKSLLFPLADDIIFIV